VVVVPPRLWLLFLFDYLPIVLMLHHLANFDLELAGWQGLQLGFLQLPIVAMVYRWDGVDVVMLLVVAWCCDAGDGALLLLLLPQP
jgi:hypothetical protein